MPLGSGQCLIGCGDDFFEPLGFELGDGFRESTTICDGSQKNWLPKGWQPGIGKTFINEEIYARVL